MSKQAPHNDAGVLPEEGRRLFLARLGALGGGLALTACGGSGGGHSGDGAEPQTEPSAPATSPSPAAAPRPAPAPPGSPPTASPPPAPQPLPPTEPAQGGVYTPEGAVGSIDAMIPPPGYTSNVSLNNLSALNPCPGGGCWFQIGTQNDSPWRNWTGAAFASGFSKHGAMVYWGGGHHGGNDVSLYVFDFTTALWSRIGPENPPTDYTDDWNVANSKLDATWYDYLWQGNYIVPALHTYAYPTYVPPGVSGTGSKGSWLLPQLVGGKGSGAKPHAVDLATGVWTRFSSAPGVTPTDGTFSGSIFDSKRNRIYWASCQSPKVNMLDLNEPHPRQIHVQTLASGKTYAPSAYYPVYVYVADADLAIEFGADYGQSTVRAVVYDTSGTVLQVLGRVTLPATAPMSAGFGVDWCPITRKFYFYSGYGSSVVRTLAPSSLDFMTCTWTWGQEVFAGAAWTESIYGRSGGEVVMNRWRYIPGLKCFAWTDGPRYRAACADGAVRDGVMQLWRPLNT